MKASCQSHSPSAQYMLDNRQRGLLGGLDRADEHRRSAPPAVRGLDRADEHRRSAPPAVRGLDRADEHRRSAPPAVTAHSSNPLEVKVNTQAQLPTLFETDKTHSAYSHIYLFNLHCL